MSDFAETPLDQCNSLAEPMADVIGAGVGVHDFGTVAIAGSELGPVGVLGGAIAGYDGFEAAHDSVVQNWPTVCQDLQDYFDPSVTPPITPDFANLDNGPVDYGPTDTTVSVASVDTGPASDFGPSDTGGSYDGSSGGGGSDSSGGGVGQRRRLFLRW